MILQLANLHREKIAGLLFFVLGFSFTVPAMAGGIPDNHKWQETTVYNTEKSRMDGKYKDPHLTNSKPVVSGVIEKPVEEKIPVSLETLSGTNEKPEFIGGPGQPEMASFKSVGTDNMVNLFTGDFGYNIPLLDVGGYPVNIYYDGGISPEQEASWVGLGWNVNPGNINRNMRGVPDDFNGQDTLKQLQVMKPNKTWGLGFGGDVELFGKKGLIKDSTHLQLSLGANYGVAFNNYLGPSLDFSLKGNVGYNTSRFAGSEKLSLSASLSGGIDINSRAGTSFTAGASLTAGAFYKGNTLGFGGGLSTGYNSRTGIKSLQIYDQMSFNVAMESISKKIKGNFGRSMSLHSQSISFTKPSYIPSIRMPVTNSAWSGRFQLGLGNWGVAADVEAELYGQKSEVTPADTLQKKLMVGYLYYQNAVNNPDYVMDFTRFNDKEVTPNTPVISVPQYSFDVFSIQGEGTGGSIRAYRNDLGYVRDNTTISKDKNISVGADVDPPGHYGGNFANVKTPSTIGEWGDGNNLRNSIHFRNAGNTFENVYFRNPGETSVIDSARFSQLGGTDLVRFVLSGSAQAPVVEPRLQVFNSSLSPLGSQIDLAKTPVINTRNKRTQVINFLTADETAKAGLDKFIKSYDNIAFLDNVTDTLLYESIQRVGGIRKAHHLSQINVTEGNGRRYVYGVPVYNILQKDFTFSVANSYTEIPDKVGIDSTTASGNSSLLGDHSNRDGYVQITTTPAYTHSFLLSGILSPDYVDVTGNGITEDDLGTSVKFNYTRIKSGNNTAFKWRTPLSTGNEANFNPGNRSEVKDDKALFTYGERESWYLQSIESKTMIALFYVSNRHDGKGAAGVLGGIDGGGSFVKKLDSISLYSKPDIKKNGLSNAKPIKTVHFVYSYKLCQNTPDNDGSQPDSLGKLTLKAIYSTYNGKTRAVKNKYSFYYSYLSADTAKADNPDYAFASSDRWGVYKSQTLNPGGLKNSDYPFSYQPVSNKAGLDQNASAWMLKKIVLPSGGQIEVNYESDDYAFVQNKRATVMMQVAGFSNNNSFATATDRLYRTETAGSAENDYVFIRVPESCQNAADVYKKYLDGISQLCFKIWVQMPKGAENITSYAEFGSVANTDYGVDANNNRIIWVKLKRLGNKNPLSITALEYLRQQLPGQAFKGYDVSGEPKLKQVADMLMGMLLSLRDAFSDPVNAFRKDGKAMHTDTSRSFVRLNDPDGYKYGGGHRVKSVVLQDNWNKMTGQYTSKYGQKYDYTTSENFNGQVRRISSGVASYEPAIGGEENPFQSVIQVEDYLPSGPTSYGAVEMPVLDAFFPAPLVGYSKVTVSSIKEDTIANKKSRSGIGKQVTEFYTAKDFPVLYSYTPFDPSSQKEFHQDSRTKYFHKYAYDYKSQTQGFLIVNNDMHGKMKSQSSYAQNDTTTRISYTENFYRNTGINGINDKFLFIKKEGKGTAYNGNMGIDIELMTDTREFSVKGNSKEYQGQADVLFFGAIPVPVPTLWKVQGISENIYRAVTTTKVVNFHSVLDSVVVIDKGSMVSTKNLAFDAETGEVLVSKTNNVFNKPVYSTSYPTHWAYSGMGLAYKNIDAVYSAINFSDGKIINPGFDLSVFESGDELLIKSASVGVGCDATLSSGDQALVWAFDRNRNSTSLASTPDFIFIDAKGIPYTMSNVSFRIVRSGHRNMIDARAAAVTSMVNPLVSGKLMFDTASKVINASAVEFWEKWQTDNDVIRKLKLVTNPSTCVLEEVEDTAGYLEKSINPYRKGLLGNYRSNRSMVFYDGRKEYDTAAITNIAEYGYLKNFKPYWNFNIAEQFLPDTTSSQWVWNTKLNKVNAKGLELETMDALGIYTSAQYGYDKSLPVAISSNARFNEAFADGFEDYGYGESISNASFNARKKFIDFGKMTNSYVVNTDSTGFKAHSGKYVLGVNGTGVLSIPLASEPQNYRAETSNGTLTGIVKGPLGGNLTNISSSVYFDNTNTTFNQGDILGGVWYTLQPYTPTSSISNNQVAYSYLISAKHYFEITSNGTYVFKFRSASGKETSSYSNFPAFSSIYVYDSVNNLGYSGTDLGTTSDTYSKTKTRSFCLNKGVYIMYLQFYASYNYSCTPGPYTSFCTTGGSNAYLIGDSYSVMDVNTPSYSSVQFFRNYTTITNCTYTKPAPATDSMMHSTFSVVPGKKMLFSTWVRENCGNANAGIPCKEYTYTHNQVKLSFTGSPGNDVNLFPTGGIIDGWQRYEGVFTVPLNATGLSINLINNGSSTVYFDDIRIHPFNANMKSYVYDPVNLRLTAELDGNNYGSFYEYDEEGTLIRTKVETREGVKTISETRSSLQKVIQ